MYGPGLLYEVDANGNAKTYHYDSRGSSVALTSNSGGVIDRMEYSPYGTMTRHTIGTSDTPFLYNGRFGVMTDANGLLYMRARYYNPYIKRFINADPSGMAGGMNWYAFADGNPISEMDPFGLCGTSFTPSWFQNRAASIFQATASVGNEVSGGDWARSAEDSTVNAYQMYYQWVNGTGPSTRNFDQNSVMGSQMLKADYVQTAVLNAGANAMNGTAGKVDFARNLGSENPVKYALYDFPSDALGANPARAFQGSIVGRASYGAAVNTGEITVVPITVTMVDHMTAVSGTRASGTVGGYSQNPTAVFTGENP